MQTSRVDASFYATREFSRGEHAGLKQRFVAKGKAQRQHGIKISAKSWGRSSNRRRARDVELSVAFDASPVTEASKRKQKIAMRIDGQWYDCTGWARAHPGGARFIEYFNGRDATDAFYALHSYGPNGCDIAKKRLLKLPKCEEPEGVHLPERVDSKLAASCDSFREFRVKLEEDGWFKRNPFKEAVHILQTIVPFIWGTSFAFTHPVAATILIGVGMQQAGWLAHDFIHGRGKYCNAMTILGSLLNGFSTDWWVQKHSMHHVFTNEHNKDEDITMEPIFYLQKPEDTGAPESFIRRFQHLYGYPLYTTTYMLWRFDSMRSALRRKDYKELALMTFNYCWLAYLPLPVAVGSVLLGGLLVGALVSATHQSEEIMFEQGEFVDVQFRSTRDAEVKNPFLRFLWGGMDTQLEHHLFPTMPRYKYHKLRPLLQVFSEKNGFGYRISPDTTIIRDNWHTLKEMARP